MSQTLRLLLVDDEAPARTRLRNLLDDIAAEVPTIVVAEAQDGHSALHAIQAQSCDIALVDIRMPGMDGVEFARHLAYLPQAPAVIFVTAEIMYSATCLIKITSELKRWRMTWSTACMSAAMGAYRVGKFTADQQRNSSC
jgi:CheY-like chemotaxis protein